ncbi:Chromosome partition protein Smc [uncultured archaeon]|nr:Chromosome partition protein Smc [uncultured archaeon]
MINDLNNKLENAESAIKNLNKEFNKSIDENRKGYLELINGMRDETNALRRVMFQQEKEEEEYDSLSKSSKRDAERIRREIGREREKMLDDVTRTSQDISRIYATADMQISGLKTKLAGIKGQFGGFAELSDKLNAVRADINSVEKERDALSKELGDLSNQMRAISALGEGNVAKKSLDIEDASTKIEGTKKKVRKLNSKMDKVRDDVNDIGK